MNGNSAMNQSYRKESNSEENFKITTTSLFVPPKMPKTVALTTKHGIEYSPEVTNDTQYINKIFETNSYDHNQESLVDFYCDVCYIMNSKELIDKRNIGAVMGLAAFGVFGVFTFGLGFVGGVAGVVFGGTLGRIVANKISDRKSKKKDKITQEDLFLMKLKCMVEVGKGMKKTFKLNLNRYRLALEKIIEESAPALEYTIFQKQKPITETLLNLRKIALEKRSQVAIFLSYKLFKSFLDRQDMSKQENLLSAAKKINGVFVPYVRLIEMGYPMTSPPKNDPSLGVYHKLKALLEKPQIAEIQSHFPEHKITAETLEKFKSFLRQQVDITEPMKKAMSRNPQSMTESVMEKPTSRVNKSAQQTEHKEASDKIVRGGSLQLDSPCSDHAVRHDDVGEEVKIRKTDTYNFEFSKTKSFTALEQHTSIKMGPKMLAAKVADVSVNEPSSLDEPNWQKSKNIDRKSTDKLPKGQSGNQDHNNEDMCSPKFVLLKKDSEDPMEDKPNSALHPGREGDYKRIRTTSQDRSQLVGLIQEQENSLTTLPKKEQPIQHASPEKEKKDSKVENNIEKPLAEPKGIPPANKAVFDRVVKIAYDEVSKWDKVLNTPNIRIEKIRPEGSPMVLIRAWAFIEGYTPREIFDQIFDSENRAKWDTVTVGLNVIEKIDEHTQIIHFIIKAPFGVSDRDFVQRRNYQHDYPEKGTTIMSFQSFAHPKCPPVKHRVRGETHIAGYILKPSTRAPNSTELCILSQVDIKGSIPKIVVNLVAGKAPAEWVHKLVKACERTRKEREEAAQANKL